MEDCRLKKKSGGEEEEEEREEEEEDPRRERSVETKCKHSGSKDNDRVRSEPAKVCLQRSGCARTSSQAVACKANAIARRGGLRGPRTELKPAQPNEKKFRTICRAQHEEAKRLIAPHHFHLWADSSMAILKAS
jgi:hypothetical protein